MHKQLHRCSFVVLGWAVAVTATPAYALTQEWIRQFGTAQVENAFGISADGTGSIFVSGYMSDDAILRKYDSNGNLIWNRQYGSSSSDTGLGVAGDGLGNVYQVGETRGNLVQPVSGDWDAFLSKFDADGNRLWTKQFGTNGVDEADDVEVDALGNVFVTGYTSGNLGGDNAGFIDMFLSKFDSSGNTIWTRQLGSSQRESGSDVSLDGLGNVYVTGTTEGTLGGTNAGGQDAFVTKYDLDGNLQWIRQFGTASADDGDQVAADSLGNVFVVGDTFGSLASPNAGSSDIYLTKMDQNGNTLWTRQFGTDRFDSGYSVDVDNLGNAIMTGVTDGKLGEVHAGNRDLIVSKFTSSGKQAFLEQFGTAGLNIGQVIAMDGPHHFYVAGQTEDEFGGPLVGRADIFLAKFRVPEPSTLMLACALSLASFCRRETFRRRANSLQ